MANTIEAIEVTHGPEIFHYPSLDLTAQTERKYPMPEFARTTPLSIKISLPSGSVDVVAEERDNVNVSVTPLGSSRQDREAAEATSVILNGDELTIEPPKGNSYLRSSVQLKIEVQTPIDSDIRVSVASATVNCTGRYRNAIVNSASGNFEVSDATGDVKIQTASGDGRIADVGGQLRLKTASGDFSAGVVKGSARLRTASGDIDIADTYGDVQSKSASGDLKIGTAHRGVISANSASGEVSVGVIPNTGVWLDLDSKSGNVSSDLDSSGDQSESADLTIQVRTMSGDIDIVRTRENSTAQT